MSDPEAENAVNDTPGEASHQITVNCDLMWSRAQEFSYLRLADKKDDGYRLIGLYAARARRIAATYARFYLETEEGGDSDKLGRYYWMALGAFASKTVSCLLDMLRVELAYFGGKVTFGLIDADNIANGLGQGNLWLFGDIAPSHWFYNHYPDNFFNGMACLDQRNSDKFVEPVKSNIRALPWFETSLHKIDNFRPSSDLIEGFEHVQQIENMAPSEERENRQFEHLIAIANHEQGAVLQPLIYDDPEFNKWTARERWVLIHWAAPKYELVFTRACTTDDELVSEAPDDLIIEDFDNRMDWITDAAEMFHQLMRTKNSHMMTELQAMASWTNSPDASRVY